MRYELYDVESGACLADDLSLELAARCVGDALHVVDFPYTLELVGVDATGHRRSLARGEELTALVAEEVGADRGVA